MGVDAQRCRAQSDRPAAGHGTHLQAARRAILVVSRLPSCLLRIYSTSHEGSQ